MMANPLFNLLGANPLSGIVNMMSQFRQDPMAMLQKSGLNIPSNLSDPDAIINHLVRSGQINQNQLNQAQQIAQMLKRK